MRLAVYNLRNLRPRMRRQLLLRQCLLRGQALLRAQARAQLLSDVALVYLLLPLRLFVPLIPLHPPHIHPLAPPSLHPPHIHPLAPPSLYPLHMSPLAPPSLHLPHIPVLGLTFVHPPHGHFLSCHLFHPFTWVLIQPLLTCYRTHPPTVRLLALLQPSTHPIFRLSRLLAYLQRQKVGQNAYLRHLLVGQRGTNMDIKLGLRHLTKDMQDLLLII